MFSRTNRAAHHTREEPETFSSMAWFVLLLMRFLTVLLLLMMVMMEMMEAEAMYAPYGFIQGRPAVRHRPLTYSRLAHGNNFNFGGMDQGSSS